MTDKEIIIDKVNVRTCSVYKDGICLISKEKCNAKCDYAAYYLYEQLQCKEQECERLKEDYAELEQRHDGAFQDFKRLTQKCENLEAEEKYLKQCCQKAGEELAKHSFEYDGKEKNLVVQVMELNEKYELLKIQNQQQYIEFKNKEINYEEQIRQLRLLNKELRDCLENDLTKLCVQKQEVLNEIK